MPRNKYLVVFDTNTGEWVNSVSELTRTFVFEAENDDEALMIVASYAKGRKKCTPMLLASITKGIEFNEISTKTFEQLANVATAMTDTLVEEANFTSLSPGVGMIYQLKSTAT